MSFFTRISNETAHQSKQLEQNNMGINMAINMAYINIWIYIYTIYLFPYKFPINPLEAGY